MHPCAGGVGGDMGHIGNFGIANLVAGLRSVSARVTVYTVLYVVSSKYINHYLTVPKTARRRADRRVAGRQSAHHLGTHAHPGDCANIVTSA